MAHNLASPCLGREPKARVATNDMKDMEDMEHHGESEDHVLTTMEKNPNKKEKEEKIKRMLIEIMATHETLAENFFESNLKKKHLPKYMKLWVKM